MTSVILFTLLGTNKVSSLNHIALWLTTLITSIKATFTLGFHFVHNTLVF